MSTTSILAGRESLLAQIAKKSIMARDKSIIGKVMFQRNSIFDLFAHTTLGKFSSAVEMDEITSKVEPIVGASIFTVS